MPESLAVAVTRDPAYYFKVRPVMKIVKGMLCRERGSEGGESEGAE